MTYPQSTLTSSEREIIADRFIAIRFTGHTRRVLHSGSWLLIMPALAHAKKRVAVQLGSRALVADATQTSLCAYLSVILIGLLLNALLGWWWADSVAALAMVPIIAKEGVEGVRGDNSCDDCN
jgi:divalent metal cation (Fe/Co/Zn/Cd) transporter